MTARVKKVIEEMAELSPTEMAELVERVPSYARSTTGAVACAATPT